MSPRNFTNFLRKDPRGPREPGRAAGNPGKQWIEVNWIEQVVKSSNDVAQLCNNKVTKQQQVVNSTSASTPSTSTSARTSTRNREIDYLEADFRPTVLGSCSTVADSISPSSPFLYFGTGPGTPNREFIFFMIFQICSERLRTSTTTTFWRLQNTICCQRVVPVGTTF